MTSGMSSDTQVTRAPALSAGALGRIARIVGLNLVGLGVLLGVWQLSHVVVGQFLPPPLDVARTALANLFDSRYLVGLGLPRGGYWPHLQVTLVSVLTGVVLGALIGTATGLASAYSEAIRQIISPLAGFFGVLPLLVAAPFFLMWFGLGSVARISLVVLYSTLVVHTYAYRSVGNINPRFREYAATLGAGQGQAFVRVVFPAALPEIFGGVRFALSAGWGLAAITEILGSVRGVGRVIITTWGVYDITTMLAAIVWLSLLAIILDGLLLLLRRWLLRWA